MVYIADTHALFWFLTNDSKLSRRVLKIFEEAEEGNFTIIIPSIVLAELMYILEKKDLREKFKEVIEILKESETYEIYPLDMEIIERTFEIESVKELHDRIIIATAQLLACVVITKDKEIVKSGVEFIW